MMIIRKEQKEALKEYMQKQYADNVFAHLRSNLPAETDEMSDDELRNLIQTGIDKAEGYGITDGWDVCRYVEYQIRCRPDFDTHPDTSWASQILHNDELDGTQKMDSIDHHYTQILKGEL